MLNCSSGSPVEPTKAEMLVPNLAVKLHVGLRISGSGSYNKKRNLETAVRICSGLLMNNISHINKEIIY